MSIPAMHRYPVPASARRAPTNNFTQLRKPTGGEYARGLHGGSDIPPAKPKTVGDLVFSAWPGTVFFAEPKRSKRRGTWGASYGNRVLVKHAFVHRHAGGIRHSHAWFSFYAHLDLIETKAGFKVDAVHFARLGDTGDVTGPHVHFEVHTSSLWKKGLVDPFPSLDAIRRKGLVP